MIYFCHIFNWIECSDLLHLYYFYKLIHLEIIFCAIFCPSSLWSLRRRFVLDVFSLSGTLSLVETDRCARRHPPGMQLMMAMMMHTHTRTETHIAFSSFSVYLCFWMRTRKRCQSLVWSWELTDWMFWNGPDNRNRIWDFTVRWIVIPDVAGSYLNTRRSHFHLWFLPNRMLTVYMNKQAF